MSRILEKRIVFVSFALFYLLFLIIYLKVIPQYCIAHPLLSTKSCNHAIKCARIPRARYCFSNNVPGKDGL